MNARQSTTLALLALLAGACAPVPTAPGAVVWVYDVRAAAAPTHLSPEADDLVILNTVASVIAHDMKLPLPATVNAVAYSSKAALVDGLVLRGATLEQAQAQAEGAAAVAAGNGILLRADLLARATVAYRVFVFAHELGHIAQGRARASTPMWIVEGHADWIGYRVLDVLQHRPYAPSLERVRRAVVQSDTPRDQFPALSDLESHEAWQRAVTRFGSVPTYGQAFLAVDRLVAQQTADRVHQFMFDRPPGRMLIPLEVEGLLWSGIFDVTYRTFVGEFREHLNDMR